VSEERVPYTTLSTLDDEYQGHISMPNYAHARTDANHAEIREAVRAAGYFWLDTFRAGEGVPDCFVLSKSRRWVALEIKSGDNKLTHKERDLFNTVGAGPLYTVGSVEDALEILALYDKKECWKEG
jgi:hypothetical protein